MSDSMSEESDVEMEDSSACESEEDEEIELQIKVKRKGLTGFLASLGFNKPNTRHGTTLHEHESTFWNMIYPNTGEALNEGETSEDKVQGPPSYEEIFPAGSSDANPDYSAAALEPEKKVIATAPELTTAPSSSSNPTATESPEELSNEMIQQIKSKRKKIQNDRMFLYFWLPVFIFILVWSYMKIYTICSTIDPSANVREKALTVFKSLIGKHDKKLLKSSATRLIEQDLSANR